MYASSFLQNPWGASGFICSLLSIIASIVYIITLVMAAFVFQMVLMGFAVVYYAIAIVQIRNQRIVAERKRITESFVSTYRKGL